MTKLNRMIRLVDLPQYAGLKRTQIAALVEAGEFPKPIKLSEKGRALAWLECDLIAWQNCRILRTRENSRALSPANESEGED